MPESRLKGNALDPAVPWTLKILDSGKFPQRRDACISIQL